MEGKLSAFERRMKILSVLVNGRLISRLELSRWFDVSDVTINADIIAISTVVPITSKKGRYGGIYLLDTFKTNKAYLSVDEENLLKKLSKNLSGYEKILLESVVHKYDHSFPLRYKAQKVYENALAQLFTL